MLGSAASEILQLELHEAHRSLGWLQVTAAELRRCAMPLPASTADASAAASTSGCCQLSLTCPMQALLSSQVPAGSALAKLRQQELDTLQGKGKEPSFEPMLWDRVYQVSRQVWQS